MSIVSMTGFGRGQASAGGAKVEAELSSVNRRQFDVRVGLPKALAVHEPRVGALIHAAIERGAVTGSVRIAVSGALRRRGAVIDADTASAYVEALRRTARHLGLKDYLTAQSLTQFPEVMHYEDAVEGSDLIWKLVEKAVNAALGRLMEMRRTEGRALERDLSARLANLEQILARIKKQAPSVTARYTRNLRKRLEEADVQVAANDPQLLKELTVFADRSAISEEIVRLESHFKQAGKLMKSPKPAGRSLDFLCQEMFREINTIGSKANDALISRLVVQFKTELECVREQVQNVE